MLDRSLCLPPLGADGRCGKSSFFGQRTEAPRGKSLCSAEHDDEDANEALALLAGMSLSALSRPLRRVFPPIALKIGESNNQEPATDIH